MQQPTKDLASPVIAPLSLKELAELLVIHHGLHEGIYDLAIGFQIAVGAVGPSPVTQVPGAMIGVSNIGIVRSEIEGPNTVDAAKVNPLKKPRKAIVPKA